MSIAEKLITIADNELKVYKAGQKVEYNNFWDNYLADNSVTHTSHMNKFSGAGWNDNTFYPTQDIKLGYANGCFKYCLVSNIRQRLIDCGVSLDYSMATDLGSMFEGATTTEIPVVDLSALAKSNKSTQGQRLCYNCTSLITIEKIITAESITYANSFTLCRKLENVIFEGVIGNDINFQYSPLTIESMISIISCLKDYSTTGGSHTLTLMADRKNMLTDSQKAIATNKGWSLAWG